MAAKKSTSNVIQFPIEMGIKRPPKEKASGWSQWTNFAVGDSKFFPNGELSKLSASASTWGSKRGRKFSCRKWMQNKMTGVRVWRIK